MERVADAFATLFTFLLFLFIILAPMLMAFLRSKGAQRKDAKETGKKSSRKKGLSLIEALRRADRISEPRVNFSEQPPPEKRKPERTIPERRPQSDKRRFEEVDEAFDKPLSEKFTAIGDEGTEKQTTASPFSGISGTRMSRTLDRLPELQKAVVMAEILASPKALRE